MEPIYVSGSSKMCSRCVCFLYAEASISIPREGAWARDNFTAVQARMRSGQECIDYLNSTVWATLKKSPIHNVGVFAIRDIPKGTTISDYTHNKTTTLNKLTDEELQKVYPEIRKLILDRMVFLKEDKKLEFFSPNSDAVLQCWMNHSKSPNTTGTKTLRDIKKGEELTEDIKAIAGGPLHSVSTSHFKFLHRGSTRKNKNRS